MANPRKLAWGEPMKRLWVWVKSLPWWNPRARFRSTVLAIIIVLTLIVWAILSVRAGQRRSTLRIEADARHRCVVVLHSLAATPYDSLMVVSLFPECLAVVQGRMRTYVGDAKRCAATD